MSEDKSQGVQLSEAVAAQLSAASAANKLGPFAFIAKHWTLPIFTKEQLETLVVTTRCRGHVRRFISRSQVQHEYLIEVAVRQEVKSDESLTAEGLFLLAEKIGDFYERDDTDTGQTRTVTGRTEKLISGAETQFVEEKLHELRVICCVVQLTFAGWR